MALVATFAAACGDSAEMPKSAGADTYNNTNGNSSSANNQTNGDNEPPIETERFVVREVATTDAYVFVPNADPTSSTVARVDARDLSVIPLRVGQGPTDVAARDVEGVGAVAYVLCEGNATVAIVRADAPARSGKGLGDVRLFKLPSEVNRLTMAPDGRHAVAWIDPTRSLANSPIASLQVMSLIRLGDTPDEDRVFNLSVTRLIRDIEFTQNGEMFILGREGINRVRLSDVTADRLVPRMDLGLDSALFPADTFEMEVASDGGFLVVRSRETTDLMLYSVPEAMTDDPVGAQIALPAYATDIDLLPGEPPRILATMPQVGALALIDVDSVAEETYAPELIELGESLGLSQITPDGQTVVAYTTVAGQRTIAKVDLASRDVSTMVLRDRVYSLATSSDSTKAIAVHTAGEIKMEQTATDLFQQYNGLTLIDLATGYLRPVVLQGEPSSFVMTQAADHGVLYVLLQRSASALAQGVMRINLDTFRSDFVSLPKQPNQLGRVGNKIFVSQEASDGRLTFFDVDTHEQRTVSGYELNAVID